MTALEDRPVLLGRAVPRLLTPPLAKGPAGQCGCGCALSPATSLGFEAESFATDVLGISLLPWQRYWLIHALELRGDGGYRFRTVLTLVSRQQGKTSLLKIVSLWAMYMGRANLVLGAAQSLDIARESWAGAVELAEDNPELAAEIDTVRRTNGEQCLTLTSGARYRITAATRSAGRGLSVDLLILDELREHRTSEAWAALSKTTMARPGALIVGISNAGDDESVVLNGLRSAALAGTDPALGIFEWSAPDGCALDDTEAWAQACPGLGITVSEAAIRAALTTDPPNVFRTELLCQRVDALNSAVDPAAWKSCADPGATLKAWADQVVVCVDVSYDDHHVTAAAAAPAEDGKVRGEILGAWPSTAEARAALRKMFEYRQPRAVGWFPSGPAAILGADLQSLHGECIGQKKYALVSDEMLDCAPGVVELKGQEAATACQTLADLVDNRMFIHPDHPLLNAHIAASKRQNTGDGWRFARRGSARNDAAYAMAGAVYLARNLPLVANYDVLSSVF